MSNLNNTKIMKIEEIRKENLQSINDIDEDLIFIIKAFAWTIPSLYIIYCWKTTSIPFFDLYQLGPKSVIKENIPYSIRWIVSMGFTVLLFLFIIKIIYNRIKKCEKKEK